MNDTGVLEVIEKGARSASHPIPLLFVHGGYHAAWCWDDHFLDFFADRGYRVLAPSLRGHGGSALSQQLNDCSIADYVDDIARVAADLIDPPVVIGHSMGGYVVQKYLERHSAPAGVLVASGPPHGMLAAGLRSMVMRPWATLRASIRRDMFAVVGRPPLTRAAFFTKETPESIVAQCFLRLQQESCRALSHDLVRGDLPQPQLIGTPLLVLGASYDGLIKPRQVRATARAYRTTAHFFPMGHNMMLEPGWAAVAQHIDSWLTDRGL